MFPELTGIRVSEEVNRKSRDKTRTHLQGNMIDGPILCKVSIQYFVHQTEILI